ncbi:MAG TPA: hypothetical protein VK735_43185 [Pseudonocardia sp.]|nr:hypothetical protein [Pseudonocardia sp.]
MKPLKKMTATMNTTPATMPTHATTAVSLLGRRPRSCGGGGAAGGSAGGGAAAMGPVVGSVDVVVSLMSPMMVAVVRCD